MIVLGNSCIRIEYDSAGIFEDRPTQVVLYRDMDVPSSLVVKREDTTVQISTDRFCLWYNSANSAADPVEHFSEANLKIDVLDPQEKTTKTWRFSLMETITDLISLRFSDKTWLDNNLMGTARTLDRTNGTVQLEPGWLSSRSLCVLTPS